MAAGACGKVQYMKGFAKYLMLVVGMAFLAFGIYRGEMDSVFSKAIRLCMECVGIG